MKALLLAATLAAGPALAQPALPTLFDVTGVASGDVLNVRSAPSGEAGILATRAPDARGIEVVALDPTGAWAQINLGEGAAWVALRYLAEREGVWSAGRLPETLRCFGTEPFWSIGPRDGALLRTTPDGEAAYPLTAVLDQDFAPERRRIALAAGDAGRLTLVVSPTICSDGMSDRIFGLRADAVLEADGVAELQTGCCSVAP